uniref:EGF-like domain-containing protein n=1 Tax=Steinernema glaseri TaxID=37863 RepID=A0A1I8A6B7_9BILA
MGKSQVFQFARDRDRIATNRSFRYHFQRHLFITDRHGKICSHLLSALRHSSRLRTLLRYGGVCRQRRDEYVCSCPPGFAGEYCEIDHTRLHCNLVNCGDGVCDDKSGSTRCICPVYASGDRCEINNLSNCIDSEYCKGVAANGICDAKCNKPECQHDFGDCEGQGSPQ